MHHSLGLKSDGSIVAGEDNDNGQSTSPPPTPASWRWQRGLHSLGLKSDGSIVAWGDNSAASATYPHPNSGFVAVRRVCVTAWASSPTVPSWPGDTTATASATSPPPTAGFVAVAAGGYHSLGLKSDGSIVAWGNNGYGQ